MLLSVGLIFGNNYSNSPYELTGCVNDARKMERMLKETLLFNDVEVFTEVKGQALCDLVLDAVRRTHMQHVVNLWIHFSGHAGQVRSNNSYESDGLDECIVPVDFQQVGLLRDNFFRDALKRVNPRTNVICTFDCCHSGTITDLKYAYTRSNFGDPVITHSAYACDARVICLSGCRDAETAKEKDGIGIMTGCLVELLEREGPLVSLRTLIDSLRSDVQDKNSTQYPVLSSSKRIDFSDILLRILV